MNRRMFVAVGASVAAVGAGGDAVARGPDPRPAQKARRVTATGWLWPAPRGPGHYFVLEQRREADDPRPTQLTLVYPLDAAAMRPGPARIEGWLYQGRFKDEVTGHATGAVLTGARLV